MRTANIVPNVNQVPSVIKIPDDISDEGGQAEVYFTSDHKYVVKIYTKKQPPNKYQQLEKIISLGKNLRDDGRYAAWPLAIVTGVDLKPRLGVVTRFVPYKELTRLCLTPHSSYKQFKQGASWLNYLKIGRAVAAATRSIHDRGVAHGDISLKNVLADISSGEATLIDLDGIIVEGWFDPQVKGTPGFMAPELYKEIALRQIAVRDKKTFKTKEKPSKWTDLHSLAVTVLWILLFRNVMQPLVCYDVDDDVLSAALGFGDYASFSENPKDLRNLDRRIGLPFTQSGWPSYHILSPRTQFLTKRALIMGLKNPRSRPEAREWEFALMECYDLLHVCTNCKQTIIYPYWKEAQRRKCLFCAGRIEPPYPIMLQLQEEQQRGVWNKIRTYKTADGTEKYTPVLLEHGSPLFEDITIKASIAPFSRRDTRKIGICVWDKTRSRYYLRNDSDDVWEVVSGNSGFVRKGQSVALIKGLLLSFGKGKRLAKVVE